MAGLFASNKTLKKGSQKDTAVVTIGDGYNGDAYYARVTEDGYLLVDLATFNFAVQTIDAYLYLEDSPHASGDKGRFVLGVRNDADSILTNTDLDYSPFSLDASGKLKTLSSQAGIWAVQNQDGYGNGLSSTSGSLNVNLTNTPTVNQGTSPWVISGTVIATAAEDKNYGTVGANTLRVASQIGNATGAADFNAGITSTQTLRVTSNLSDGYGTKLSSTVVSGKSGLDVNIISPLSIVLSNDTNYGTVGADTLRTAAQIGNATGAADFNRGITGAQTLRTTSNLNDGYGVQIQSTSGSLNVNLTNTPTVNQGTSPWVVSGSVTATAAEDKNYGTVGANTLRVASQIGNATGAADFNRGVNTAQTLRTTSNLNDGYGTQISSQSNNTNTRNGLDTWTIKGTPQHFNGTVGTSATTITPTTTTTAVMIYNPASNASNVTLSVSFDGGTTFFDIERRGSLEIEAEVASFQIKASAAASAYQIIVTRR